MSKGVTRLSRLSVLLACVAGGVVYAQAATPELPQQASQTAKEKAKPEDAPPNVRDIDGTLHFAEQKLKQTSQRCADLGKQSENKQDVLKGECIAQAQSDCNIFEELLSERIDLLNQVKSDPELFAYHAGVLQELLENSKSSQLKTADCIGKNFNGATSDVKPDEIDDVPRGVHPTRPQPASGPHHIPYIPSPASGVS